MDRCEECGHVTSDTYARDPRTNRSSSDEPAGETPQQKKRWCVPCFEKLHARAAREHFAPEG